MRCPNCMEEMIICKEGYSCPKCGAIIVKNEKKG